ncbi:TIGR03960 family B12-binding radical SAM protein [bacterium]|nr:TIGR03960 family B12-binding radical SAM protein [bacterium]
MEYQDQIKKILQRVKKPGRYLGEEWNQIKKDPQKVEAKVGLVFPELYEVGMSYTGQKILYDRLNRNTSILAERIFAPGLDLEKELRSHHLPIFSLENWMPIQDFDILGFSLLYELNYTNILTLLDLGEIPFYTKKRDLSFPLIIAGGPAAFNPEPLADLFDLFLIGEGEEAFDEIVHKYIYLQKQSLSKHRLLKELSKIKGVYVPSFYEPYTPKNSSLMAVKPSDSEVPPQVEKRLLYPYQNARFPQEAVVPNTKVIFERVAVEVARGCFQNCRFCQASSLYFPPRVKDPGQVVKNVMKSLHSTGYEDASLASLSVSDYPYLEQVVKSLMDKLSEKKISLSLPSLRPKGLTSELIQNIIKVRKTGFTLAPEAGTDRLREVVNKNIHDEEIWEAAANAFHQGWKSLKLYYMVGLPTEREEDLEAIIKMVENIVTLGQKILQRPPQINLSISSFIPKPHTPFQWLGVEDEKVQRKKQRYIKSRLKKYPFVKFNLDNPQSFILETVFSRGDRRLGKVLIEAWENGARFDSWSDTFDFSIWKKSFEKQKLDYHVYLSPLNPQTVLPWDHISTGIKKSHFLQELNKAYRGERTLSCLERECQECEGCTMKTFYPKTFSEKSLPPLEKPSYLGKKKEETIRYRVTYAKLYPLQFISHGDLNNLIQRILRRAGIPVVHTQGFHPKMKLSFLPALPLGMKGEEEIFEFNSFHEFSEKEFLSRINRWCPSGIEFKKIRKISRSLPPLNESLQRMVYSLDYGEKEVKEAFMEMGKSKMITWRDNMNSSQKIIQQWKEQMENRWVQDIQVDRKNSKILLWINHDPHKTTSPTKIVREILGREIPSHFMSRKRVELEN